MPNGRSGQEFHQVVAPLMLDHASEQIVGQVVAHGGGSGRQIDAKAVFSMCGAVKKRLAHSDDGDVDRRQRGAIAHGGVFQPPRVGMRLGRLDSRYERNRENGSIPEHFNYVVSLT